MYRKSRKVVLAGKGVTRTFTITQRGKATIKASTETVSIGAGRYNGSFTVESS